MNNNAIAIYAMWMRELKCYFRSKDRLIGSLALPIFWFIVFGAGLGSAIKFTGLETDYGIFVAPGIIAMPLLFTSVYFGETLISDRLRGFLKEALVSPVSRISIVMGKSLGGATIATMQGLLILVLSVLLGMKITASLLVVIPIMAAISIGFVSLGIAIGSILETSEGFSLIMGLIVTPLFFLSGAFFPINDLPFWMAPLARIDPMTYGVEALRQVITGSSHIPLLVTLPFVIAFSAMTTVVSTYIFTKRE